MPQLVITVSDGWLRIDGPLPDGWQLVVHNHTGDPDLYPYSYEVDECQYSDDFTVDDHGDFEGVRCLLYIEPEVQQSP
jgi:hypothetical protein